MRLFVFIFLLFCWSNAKTQTRFAGVNCDSILHTNNTHISIVYKKGKQGLYDADKKAYLLPLSENKLFYSMDFDIVIVAHEQLFSVLSLSKTNPFLPAENLSFEHVFMISSDYHSRRIRIISDDIQYDLNLDDEADKGWIKKEINQKSIQVGNQMLYEQNCFGVQKLNKNRLIVTNFSGYYKDPYATPYASFVDMNEDSVVMDEFGNWMAVYPPAKQAISASGIYDLTLNNWFIEPKYHAIFERSNGFLLQLHKDELTNYELRFDFVSDNLLTLFSNLSLDRLVADYNYLKLTIPIAEFDTVFFLDPLTYPDLYAYDEKAAAQNHHLLKVISNEKEILLDWSNLMGINSQVVLNKPKEFIYYNLNTDCYLWYNNDSVFCEFNGHFISANAQEEEILLLKTNNLSIQKTLNSNRFTSSNMLGDNIWLIRGLTSELEVINHLYLEKEDSFDLFVSILFDNGNIVINDFRKKTIKMDNFAYFDQSYNHHVYKTQTESSNLWYPQRGIWAKKTVNFAKILPVNFGYLVTTSPKNAIDIYGKEMVLADVSFLLLDNEYKAISFMDFYDFYDAEVYPFGVKLCVEKGCFLTDNNGKALTDAVWTDFILEEGKIKALKKEYDDNGKVNHIGWNYYNFEEIVDPNAK
jgi:hypothetical protein